jgi:hypothetical protein
MRKDRLKRLGEELDAMQRLEDQIVVDDCR